MSVSAATALDIDLLGALTIRRDGIALALPGSRKVRALLVYLLLTPHPVPRSQLCDLMWDGPSDPRAELRWCLSKVRALVDAPGQPRVIAQGDRISINVSGCSVDALQVQQALEDGVDKLDPAQLHHLASLHRGEFLEGLELDDSLQFNAWLSAQRRRLRAGLAAILERSVSLACGDEVFAHLDRWLELAPLDQRAHLMLLRALARAGRFKDGDEHLAASVRLFESEGLEVKALRDQWRVARTETTPLEAQPVSVRVLESDRGPDRAGIKSQRASIAVMPFIEPGLPVNATGIADGLASDLITRLAKLRSLFVIAQGTVFALHKRGLGAEEAGRILNVDYIVAGSVRRQDQRLTITVELVETRTAQIVWAERFDHALDDALFVFDTIGNRIVASVVSEIETIERNRAILRPPNSLSAWEAHHRGLWHMYWFDRHHNDRARHYFQTAIRLDPTFSRAYAGLSFTYFQSAFQNWSKKGPAIDLAYEAAGKSLMMDNRDPAARWAMGRALWLRGQHDQSVTELGHALDISPNFALAHYNISFVNSTAGDSRSAIQSSDLSRDLSPFDPMLFGMLGARAMALVRLERFDEAAEWGVKAASRPNAFAHIRAIAAYSLALAGRVEEGRSYVASIRRTLPRYGVADFVSAMQFDGAGAALFHKAARRLAAK